MTIPAEKVRAVQQTREWLLALLDRRYRLSWSDIRQKAYYLVKHYPFSHRIQEVYERAKLVEKGERL